MRSLYQLSFDKSEMMSKADKGVDIFIKTTGTIANDMSKE